ncbi:MAG TPA: hypothetical protein VFV87_02140 [Pirellulaceae bacterium]|nr:hypothetical protein [Pirellulaceae bacterium]
MPPDAAHLWSFLPWGYALTVALELPVLLVGLSPRHPISRRVFAGFWLTASTYPIVVLVLPPLVWNRWGETAYLIVAETFAPAAECLLFWLLFCREVPPPPASGTLRDLAAIAIANLVSFLVGGWLVERLLA